MSFHQQIEVSTDILSDEGSPQTSLDYLNQFSESDTWHEVWLDYAIKELKHIKAALLTVDEDNNRSLKPVAAWMQDHDSTEVLSDLINEAAYCESPVVMPLDDGSGNYGVAYPIKQNDTVKSVFACEIILPEASQIENFMARLEWLCFWIEWRFLKKTGVIQSQKIERQKVALDGYLAIVKPDEWHEAALQLADVFSKKFDCERVSIGFVHKKTVKLAVISGSSDNDLRSVSAKKIRLAMQEAFEQRALIQWPMTEEQANTITHNTAKLSSSNHNCPILSVPLVKNDELYGIVLLERGTDCPFTQKDSHFIESTIALTGLGLEEKRQGQMSLAVHAKKSLKYQLERLLKPGYLKRKIFLLALFFLTIFFSFVKGDYTINADVELEPEQIRIISAPFTGYIKSATARAGDQISADTEFVTLEDRDLRLEKIKWLSQIEQDRKKYTESLAAYDRSQAQILFAQMSQSKAQLAVTESKLERATIKAPFDSLIVSGDLSKRVGGSINQGEEMFRISPMNRYHLILFVSEYKIRDLIKGQKGNVLLSSLPNKSFEFEVTKITPVTEVRDGGTYFRVEGALNQTDVAFRPGLVGIGKVFVERRLLISIWTHDLRKWLTLKLWSFWG